MISTVAGDGIDGDSGNGGAALAAEINVQGLAVDVAGNLYMSSVPGEIRKVAVNTGVITRVAGSGYTGYDDTSGPATMVSLAGPSGMAFDGAGRLVFGDSNHFRVRRLTF